MRNFGENENLVSIVVPVYQVERFIEETIDAVQKQSYENWELILVDDCSKDRSCEVIEKMILADGRIKLIRQKTNQGAANSRNVGVSNAKGRFLCFLDSDDLWEPQKLKKELLFLQSKNAGFVFTSYEFADEQGKGLGKIVRVPQEISYSEALKNTTIFTSTVMIDRGKIEDEDILMPLIASEDTATWWHLLKKYGKAYGLDENLVKYRRSANTLSSNKIEAVKRIWNLYRKQEKLNIFYSAYCMCFWALRAVLRRV